MIFFLSNEYRCKWRNVKLKFFRKKNVFLEDLSQKESKVEKSEKNVMLITLSMLRKHMRTAFPPIYVQYIDLIAFTIYKADRRRKRKMYRKVSAYFWIFSNVQRKIYKHRIDLIKIKRNSIETGCLPCFESRKIGIVGFYFVIDNSCMCLTCLSVWW